MLGGFRSDGTEVRVYDGDGVEAVQSNFEERRFAQEELPRSPSPFKHQDLFRSERRMSTSSFRTIDGGMIGVAEYRRAKGDELAEITRDLAENREQNGRLRQALSGSRQLHGGRHIRGPRSRLCFVPWTLCRRQSIGQQSIAHFLIGTEETFEEDPAGCTVMHDTVTA